MEKDKLKAEMEKLKGKLKQTLTELEEAWDGAIKFTESNSKVVVKDFKRSDELWHYLLSYGVGSYDMACEDFHKYV